MLHLFAILIKFFNRFPGAFGLYSKYVNRKSPGAAAKRKTFQTLVNNFKGEMLDTYE